MAIRSVRNCLHQVYWLKTPYVNDRVTRRASRGKNHSALRTIPELTYSRLFVPSYHIISDQLSDQMDKGRATKLSSPPHLPSDGNVNHIRTGQASLKRKRDCGAPCDWCNNSGALCVKDVRHTVSALCASCTLALKIYLEKRYFKLMIEVLRLQSDSTDLPKMSLPRLRQERGELSLPFQFAFCLMEISH